MGAHTAPSMLYKPSMDFHGSGAWRFAVADKQEDYFRVTLLLRDLMQPFCQHYQNVFSSLYLRRPAPTNDPVRWFFHQWMTGGAWQYNGIPGMLQCHLSEADYITKSLDLQHAIEARIADWRSRHDVVAEHVLFPFRRFAKRTAKDSRRRFDCHLAIVGQLVRQAGEIRFQTTTLRPAKVVPWAEQLPHVLARVNRSNQAGLWMAMWESMPEEVIDHRASWFTHEEPISTTVSVLTLGKNGQIASDTAVEGDGQYITAYGVPNIWEREPVQQGMLRFCEACTYCPARAGCNPNAPNEVPE